MFHPKSPYYAVCADVVLVNPPGVVADHSHTLETIPVPRTFLGASIIIGAGVYIYFREKVRGQMIATDTPANR